MWLLAGTVGLIAGSVANAIIYRLPRGISWYKGRSFCPECKHPLSIYDLVPIASYLLLRGKCHYCHSPIPTRYLLVEVFMGLVFILGYLSNLGFLSYLMIWITVVIAVMDWETMLVSPRLVRIWAIIVILNLISFHSLNINNLFGLFLGLGFMWSIWKFTNGKMGDGDIEISAVLGLWLGWPKIINALWFAFVIGGIYGAYLILSKKAKLKTAVPFGPFLILGGWIAYTLNYGIF